MQAAFLWVSSGCLGTGDGAAVQQVTVPRVASQTPFIMRGVFWDECASWVYVEALPLAAADVTERLLITIPTSGEGRVDVPHQRATLQRQLGVLHSPPF